MKTLDTPLLDYAVPVNLLILSAVCFVLLLLIMVMGSISDETRKLTPLFKLICLGFFVTLIFSIAGLTTHQKTISNDAAQLVKDSNNLINEKISEKYGVTLKDPNFFEVRDFYQTAPVTEHAEILVSDNLTQKVKVSTDLLVSDVVLTVPAEEVELDRR